VLVAGGFSLRGASCCRFSVVGCLDGVAADAAKLSARSFPVNARIAPTVENRKNDHPGNVDREVHEGRKSTQHGAMNVTMNLRVDPGVLSET
jgi:hypothetical protein